MEEEQMILPPEVQSRLQEAESRLEEIGQLGVEPPATGVIVRPLSLSLGASFIISNDTAIVQSDGETASAPGTAEQPNQIIGSEGNDLKLNGTDGVDEIFGLGGNDRIAGFLSDDQIDAGPGKDFVDAGGGNDTVYGDSERGSGKPGTDVIFGDFNPNADSDRSAMGDDKAYGGAEDDDLYGQNGIDTLYGDDGNDLLQGGNGNDKLNGGSGDDILYGQNANDIRSDEADDDILNGNDGDDYLFGQNGSDTLNGGNGSDLAEGGFGNDIINGNGGNDQLRGDNGNDVFKGGSGKDIIFGGRGDDYLKGGSGNDELRGELNNDKLEGGSGNDTLIGVDATTVLNPPALGFGNDEKDTLTGNQGNDTFVLGTQIPNGKDFAFYNDGNPGNAGLEDYALITDFGLFNNTQNLGLDKVQLAGLRSNYSLGASPISSQSGTGIFFNSGVQGEVSELIGIVQNVSLEQLNLANTSQFTFA